MSEAEIILDQESKIYLTAEGYALLKAELARLTGETRAEIAERIRESQQHGEFSEDNSELDQVKTEQAFVENRIGELRSILSHAAEMDPDNIPIDHVGLGSVVKIEDLSYGDTFEVRIVSSVEADPDKDFLSSESPMGTALYGHVVGDMINFESPDGMKKIKIHRISR
jgi:transcription elongation factor GreA